MACAASCWDEPRGVHRRRPRYPHGSVVDDRGDPAHRDRADALSGAALCRGDGSKGDGERLLFAHPLFAAGRRVHRIGD